MSGRSSATEPCTLTVTMNTLVKGMGIQTSSTSKGLNVPFVIWRHLYMFCVPF